MFAYQGEKKTILVVDDENSQRTLLADLLTPFGFEVLLADDAQQGIKLLQTEQVDLALLDVEMPQMNGWQMLKRLRKQDIMTPVLMVSASAQGAQGAQNHHQGKRYHDDYISKPVNLDTLLEKIARLLKLHWQCREESGKEPVSAVHNEHKQAVPDEQYQILIGLAEIGFLSGFKEKFAEIAAQYQYPEEVASQLRNYVEQCDFAKIIEYLSGLNDEA